MIQIGYNPFTRTLELYDFIYGGAGEKVGSLAVRDQKEAREIAVRMRNAALDAMEEKE